MESTERTIYWVHNRKFTKLEKIIAHVAGHKKHFYASQSLAHKLLGKLQLLDICNLFSWVQSFGAGSSTIQYSMATVELKFIINRIKPLLCKFISAVHDPPAFTKIMKEF